MLKNTDVEYGSVSKFLHWLIFLLVLVLLIVGSLMGEIPKDSAIKGTVYNIHKLTGLTVLTLAIIRILWAVCNKKPKLANSKLWEKIAEHSVHGLLYLSLLAMPLSGWLMSCYAGKAPQLLGLSLNLPVTADKGLAEFFAETHEFFAWTIVVLVSIHVLAALKHHFIDKDNVLRRMLPRSKNR